MTTKPEATNSIHKPGAANGALASLSDARTNLPEYKRWQNAMRPEDTGHSDGAAGVPTAADQSSPFESMVRDQLSSRLGVVRNKFAQDDAILLGEISTIRPDALHFQRLLDEKRAAANRPVLIRLDRRSGFVGSVLATLLASTLMGILWLDKGIGLVTAGLVAFFGAAISSVVAYACGLMLRQGQRPWHKWLAAGMLGVVVVVGMAVCTNMRTPSFDVVERATIGALAAFAVLTVAAAAFMMHDQDPDYLELDCRAMDLHRKLTTLEVARVENRVFHTNSARRHVELARHMISSYRQSNSRSRAADCPPPMFFGVVPVLTEIADDWLKFLEVKQ